jgi:hypothetical protein
MDRPWYAAILAETPERAKVPTALEDALFGAVESALYDPRHALHQQTFGYYRLRGARTTAKRDETPRRAAPRHRRRKEMAIARISLPALHAAAQAASTGETRYWLKGVLVEIGPRQTIYVATDGHVLFACRDLLGKDERDNDLVGDWIIRPRPSSSPKSTRI